MENQSNDHPENSDLPPSVPVLGYDTPRRVRSQLTAMEVVSAGLAMFVGALMVLIGLLGLGVAFSEAQHPIPVIIFMGLMCVVGAVSCRSAYIRLNVTTRTKR
jgi:hypothetical protein